MPSHPAISVNCMPEAHPLIAPRRDMQMTWKTQASGAHIATFLRFALSIAQEIIMTEFRKNRPGNGTHEQI
jgi:hypothetical protein